MNPVCALVVKKDLNVKTLILWEKKVRSHPWSKRSTSLAFLNPEPRFQRREKI